MKKILTMLLALVMTFALNSCGNAGPSPANSSASASTSAVETEPHEYTVYDLDGLITGIGDVAVIKGSSVDLLALVSYDDTVIADVTLDSGLLDCEREGQVTVTYTITADTVALAQHLGLTIEEGTEQSISFDITKRVYVVAEDGVAEFQAKHPEVPVYTNDNVLYAPAEIPQAEVTAAPEEPAVTDNNSSAPSNQDQTTNKPASSETSTTNNDNSAPSNNASSNNASDQGASNAGTGNNKPSGTGTTNTNNGSNNSNPGSNGASGSNSGNGSAGTGTGSSGSNSGSSSNNTGNTGTGSSGNSGTQPTHKHSYSSKVTKAATCSAAGTRTYTCSCGDTYTESIPATGNHTWIEVTTTVNHEESGHWETKTVSEAWDEEIRETKAVCNYAGCGAYFDTAEEVWDHILFEHDGNASYSAKKVTTGTIHHPAVTEEVWVIDQAAWTETVVTGHKCSVCGATK